MYVYINMFLNSHTTGTWLEFPVDFVLHYGKYIREFELLPLMYPLHRLFTSHQGRERIIAASTIRWYYSAESGSVPRTNSNEPVHNCHWRRYINRFWVEIYRDESEYVEVYCTRGNVQFPRDYNNPVDE